MRNRSIDIGNSGVTSILGGEQYRPYPAYKDSGVEWLGKVPAHWVELHLKRIARIDNSGSYGEEPESSDRVLAVATTAQIDTEGHFAVDEMPLRGFSQKDANRFRCRQGDILVVKSSGSISNVISGKTGIVNANTPEFVFSNFLLRVMAHVRVVNPRYLFLLLSSNLTRERVKRMVSGSTYPNLRVEKYTSALLPIPPLSEQRAIAAFLDRETAKIDALVAKKERLIELLQEKRTALISDAVTKGLDPDVPLKDSGVEWLGEIPAHWEVKRVNRISEILRGKFTHRPRNDPALYDGPYPFVQTGDVSRARKEITGYRQTLNERGLGVSKMFPSGTLVMTIAANIGDVAVLDFAACFPDSVVGFVPRGGIERDFLFYVFLAMKPELLREAPVNTQGNLNIERIGSIGSPIPVPSRSEQRAIAAFLDRETARIDALVAKVREAIDHLKELRTALISAAVTGKIDVREAAA